MTPPVQDHAQRAHCELSPSSSHRWMACPGSISLSRGIPKTTSRYAEEGTAAHELAEKCLRANADASAYLGFEINGFKVTEEMADAVQVYLDHVRSLPSSGPVRIEHRFSLEPLSPPAPMYGTSDYTTYDAATRTLYIVDLKYGQGVPVEVEDNPQLKYYALGAKTDLEIPDVERVVMTIVQPRAPHSAGPIRTAEISADDLVDFHFQLFDSAFAALEADARLEAGEHCRFCPAHAQCPEASKTALEVAQGEFAEFKEIIQTRPFPPSHYPPNPALIPKGDLVKLLPAFDRAEEYFRAVRSFCEAELRAGREIPGFKLVEKRATRKWANEAQTLQWLASRLPRKESHEYALKSPAQIEKALKARGKTVSIPKDLVSQISSGTVMVSNSDPRPAYQPLSAGEEFPELPAAEAA